MTYTKVVVSDRGGVVAALSADDRAGSRFSLDIGAAGTYTIKVVADHQQARQRVRLQIASTTSISVKFPRR